MAELRFSALKEVFHREPVEVETPSKVVSEYYGVNVFDLSYMEQYLSKEAYKKVKRAIDEG
jgi:glutamine synthetase